MSIGSVDTTAVEVLKTFYDWLLTGKALQEEVAEFEKTKKIRKCRLPGGTWFKFEPDFQGPGVVWEARVVAGVCEPGGGVRIEPWHERRQLPAQESNPFQYVEVVDTPDWWITLGRPGRQL